MSHALKLVWANRLATACSLLAASSLLVATAAHAATEAIQFPDEELASESVLPIFDNPVSVKNRSVTTKSRFELGVQGGMSLLEPFYNPLSFGGTATYHWSEESAINISGSYFLQGLSSNAQNLNPIPNTVNTGNPKGTSVNLQYAPAPKYMLLVNYQYTGFYGKISIGKDFVMNLSLYGLAGAGAVGVGDSTKPAINVGIGQKFYFSPNLALRFDFRLVAYQGPDVLSIRLDKATGPVDSSQFADKTNYASLLTAGVSYLFPGL